MAEVAVRVLVIDDNADAVQAMVFLLEALGFDAIGTSRPEEGLLLAADWNPAILLLDLGMPGMSGYEVAERILAAPGPRPALIAWTAYGDESDRERTRRAGFTAHLVKPVEMELLSKTLRAASSARTI